MLWPDAMPGTVVKPCLPNIRHDVHHRALQCAFALVLILPFVDESLYDRRTPAEERVPQKSRLLRLLGVEHFLGRHRRVIIQAAGRPLTHSGLQTADLPHSRLLSPQLCTDHWRQYHHLNLANNHVRLWTKESRTALSLWNSRRPRRLVARTLVVGYFREHQGARKQRSSGTRSEADGLLHGLRSDGSWRLSPRLCAAASVALHGARSLCSHAVHMHYDRDNKRECIPPRMKP